MTERPRQLSTVGDVGRIAAALNQLLELVDALRKRHHEDAAWYMSASPAALDATEPHVGEHIRDLLAAVNIRFAGALDLAEAISTAASAAAALQPVSAYTPIIASRSAVEMCATIAWLEEPDVSANLRAGRLLRLAWEEQSNLEKMPDGNSTEEKASIAASAQQLGLQRGAGRREWGYGSPYPSLTARVSKLMGNNWVYSLMSAVSHGEAPALVQFGYSTSNESDGTGVLLEKAPPAYVLAFATHQAYVAVGKSTARDFAYRGWDVAEIASSAAEFLERAGYDPAVLSWTRSSADFGTRSRAG